jgi:hypothetical protein
MSKTPPPLSSATLEPRYAVVYFDLQIDNDSIAETAYDEDSPDSEYANELLSDHRALLLLEQQAYAEIKKKLSALGFRVFDEGHSEQSMTCKLGVSSWVDVDRLNRWIQGHMGGGDDVIYLDTPYASIQGFTFYPRGVNDISIGASDLDEWLSAQKPLAVDRTHSALRADLPLEVVAAWSDGVQLRRSAGSEKFFDGHWEPEEEIRFDLFIEPDSVHVLSLFLAPLDDDRVLGPAEVQFVTAKKWWRTEAGTFTRNDAICRLTWFLLSTLPEQALQLEATASLLEDLRIRRFLPESISQLTEDHPIEQKALAFHRDLSSAPPEEIKDLISGLILMLGAESGHLDEQGQGHIVFIVCGSEYSLICEEVFYDLDTKEFSPSWIVHADFFLVKRNPKASFIIVNENDVVIGAGRTPREALMDVPFFVWPGAYEEWASRMLQPGELPHKEEIEVLLILDELPPFYRSDAEFMQWRNARSAV